MYRVLIADDEELELKAMHFFLERNYPEAVLLPDAQDGTDPGYRDAGSERIAGTYHSQGTGI